MREEHCLDHSGCEARITNLEIDSKMNDNQIIAAHKRIDGIKNWVIAGMTSLVLQLIVTVFGVLVAWMKAKGHP